jgi:hypothetical protein
MTASPATRLLRGAALLEGFVDYAGLFPPAGLGMAATVANYAAYQRRDDHWALGRLVVPVARLTEFEAGWRALSEEARLGTRWPLTALLGPDLAADQERLAAFREGHIHGGPAVLSLEGKADSADRVKALAKAFGEGYEVYVELPLGAETGALITAVHEAGLRAKIRTGGTTAADFPTPDQVMRFLTSAARHLVAFKATAGLHHPVRGRAPLTYLPGSDQAVMYGYLNVLTAATALWRGGTREEAERWLTRDDRESLRIGPDGLRWGDWLLSREALVATRREFFRSVGSCSFTEPLDEIRPFLEDGA